MKDLVDHIRTVHFTVLIVALVLTIALQWHKKPQLERAASDAQAILLLDQKWSRIEDAFRKPTELHAAVRTPSKGARLAGIRPGRYMLRGYTVYPHRPVTFSVPTTWIYVDATKTAESASRWRVSCRYSRISGTPHGGTPPRYASQMRKIADWADWADHPLGIH